MPVLSKEQWEVGTSTLHLSEGDVNVHSIRLHCDTRGCAVLDSTQFTRP